MNYNRPKNNNRHGGMPRPPLSYKAGGKSPKASMSCGQVKRSSRPGKKIMKLYCIDGKKKLVHAGAKGYGHNYSAAARKSFKARHKCSTAKPGTAKHLACTELWAGKGGSKKSSPKGRKGKYAVGGPYLNINPYNPEGTNDALQNYLSSGYGKTSGRAKKAIKRRQDTRNIGSTAYGVLEGMVDALTFGLTDNLTDKGYYALQGVGREQSAAQKAQQDRWRVGGQIGGAVLTAALTQGTSLPSTIGTSIGTTDWGTFANEEDEGLQKGLDTAGTVVGIAYGAGAGGGADAAGSATSAVSSGGEAISTVGGGVTTATDLASATSDVSNLSNIAATGTDVAQATSGLNQYPELVKTLQKFADKSRFTGTGTGEAGSTFLQNAGANLTNEFLPNLDKVKGMLGGQGGLEIQNQGTGILGQQDNISKLGFNLDNLPNMEDLGPEIQKHLKDNPDLYVKMMEMAVAQATANQEKDKRYGGPIKMSHGGPHNPPSGQKPTAYLRQTGDGSLPPDYNLYAGVRTDTKQDGTNLATSPGAVSTVADYKEAERKGTSVSEVINTRTAKQHSDYLNEKAEYDKSVKEKVTEFEKIFNPDITEKELEKSIKRYKSSGQLTEYTRDRANFRPKDVFSGSPTSKQYSTWLDGGKGVSLPYDPKTGKVTDEGRKYAEWLKKHGESTAELFGTPKAIAGILSPASTSFQTNQGQPTSENMYADLVANTSKSLYALDALMTGGAGLTSGTVRGGVKAIPNLLRSSGKSVKDLGKGFARNMNTPIPGTASWLTPNRALGVMGAEWAARDTADAFDSGYYTNPDISLSSKFDRAGWAGLGAFGIPGGANLIGSTVKGASQIPRYARQGVTAAQSKGFFNPSTAGSAGSGYLSSTLLPGMTPKSMEAVQKFLAKSPQRKQMYKPLLSGEGKLIQEAADLAKGEDISKQILLNTPTSHTIQTGVPGQFTNRQSVELLNALKGKQYPVAGLEGTQSVKGNLNLAQDLAGFEGAQVAKINPDIVKNTRLVDDLMFLRPTALNQPHSRAVDEIRAFNEMVAKNPISSQANQQALLLEIETGLMRMGATPTEVQGMLNLYGANMPLTTEALNTYRINRALKYPDQALGGLYPSELFARTSPPGTVAMQDSRISLNPETGTLELGDRSSTSFGKELIDAYKGPGYTTPAGPFSNTSTDYEVMPSLFRHRGETVRDVTKKMTVKGQRRFDELGTAYPNVSQSVPVDATTTYSLSGQSYPLSTKLMLSDLLKRRVGSSTLSEGAAGGRPVTVKQAGHMRLNPMSTYKDYGPGLGTQMDMVQSNLALQRVKPYALEQYGFDPGYGMIVPYGTTSQSHLMPEAVFPMFKFNVGPGKAVPRTIPTAAPTAAPMPSTQLDVIEMQRQMGIDPSDFRVDPDFTGLGPDEVLDFNYKSGGYTGGLRRWFKEKWVDVKTGKPCGRSGKEKSERPYPYCRPSRKVSSKTPATSKNPKAKSRATQKKGPGRVKPISKK